MPDAAPPPPHAPPLPAEPDASCPLCGHPAAEGTLRDAAARLLARQEEVLQKLQEAPRKSWWERTPVLVTVVGLLFTILYQTNEIVDRRAEQRRADESRRLELMSKFFPHLISTDTAAQRGAVLALDLLADSTLAAAAVLVAPSPAAANALRDVRMNPVSVDDADYVSSVMRRVQQLEAVTRRDTAPPGPGATDTAAAP
jgi:hypothetical protein